MWLQVLDARQWIILFSQSTTKPDLFRSIGYESVCVWEKEKSDTEQGPPAQFDAQIIQMEWKSIPQLFHLFIENMIIDLFIKVQLGNSSYLLILIAFRCLHKTVTMKMFGFSVLWCLDHTFAGNQKSKSSLFFAFQSFFLTYAVLGHWKKDLLDNSSLGEDIPMPVAIYVYT